MLFLPDLAKVGEQRQEVILNDRLPTFLNPPCQIHATFNVKSIDDYYLLHLNVQSNLKIICQRCLEEFSFDYDNELNLAICQNEERAQKLLEYYESIVSVDKKVDLKEVIVDEMHLYVPLFHPEIKDCNEEILQFLDKKIDS